MGVDFNKIFSNSVRYPLRKDVFLLAFAVQLVFAVAGWFVTGYFGADIIASEGTIIPANIMPFMVYIIPIAVLGWVVNIYLIPAYMDNASHYHKVKKKGITESLEVSRKRFIPMLILSLIYFLIIAACFGGMVLTTMALPVMETAEGLAMVAAGGVWLLIGIVVFAVAAFFTYLSPAFCVLENASPLESLKKSWKTVAKNKMNTLLFFALFIIVYISISLGGSLPEMLYYIFTTQQTGLTLDGFAFMLVRTLVTTYLALLSVASLVSFYHSLKKSGE
ncbi:MAG: hypothetical protein NTU57_05680 [Candidatus Aenigmarchaeota archaeon]|nr:hypothetical protein [Candidatus Aenigmarchaeota archaeon]